MRVPGISRRRGLVIDIDPAYDDQDLRAAREDAAMGRWDAVREVLEDAGRDWDRRGHRVQVLASTALGLQWPEIWLASEPDSPHAHAVYAHASVLRLLESVGSGQGEADEATKVIEDCHRAADHFPEDPMPWISLLTLARAMSSGHLVEVENLGPLTFTVDERTWDWFLAAVARDADSWDAHHRLLETLSGRYSEAGRAGYHHMSYFASQVAERSGAASPLLLLPLYADAEIRHGLDGETGYAEMVMATAWWCDRRIQEHIEIALRDWYQDPGRLKRHPRRMQDLNVLAYALHASGRWEDAAPVFEEIGPYSTNHPWRFAHHHMNRDQSPFLAARRQCVDYLNATNQF